MTKISRGFQIITQAETLITKKITVRKKHQEDDGNAVPQRPNTQHLCLLPQIAM